MSTAYLLATWSGDRRYKPPAALDDAAYYLRRHFESLERLDHSLDLVVVIVPRNKSEPWAFSAFVQGLPGRVRQADVVVLRRPNAGLSYGSWVTGFRRFPDFDRYILQEDDYVFCVDNFDVRMAAIMDRVDCGYLCCVAWPGTDGKPFPAFAQGMVSRDAAAAGAACDWDWRKSRDGRYRQSGDVRHRFNRPFLRYGVKDVRSEFRVEFEGLRDGTRGEVVTYHDQNDELLIEPIR